METILVAVICTAALYIMIRELRKTVRGEKSCCRGCRNRSTKECLCELTEDDKGRDK